MRILLFLLCLFIVTPSFSQVEPIRYTEEEIAVQDKYVEAKKYTLIGRFEKAQEILTELYKEDRSNSAIAMELSKVYSYMEDPYNEHKFASTAHKNDPQNEYVLANYAAICMDQEKFDEAQPLLSSLVTMQPKNEEYADKLGSAYLQTNNPDAALKVYNDLQTRIGISEDVSRRKYEIYETLGKEKKALSELKQLSEAFPYEIRFLHNLASYQDKLGNKDHALTTYRKILEIDINDAKANMAITASKSGGGDDNNYLRSLTPVIENASIPVDRKILELVPYLDQLNTKYDSELADALIMLSDKISLIHPDEAKSHALKGDVLISTNNPKGAVKSYEKTISLDDRNFLVWEGLMDALTETKDFSKLKTIATDALDLFPNKTSAYVYYGRAHTLTGDVDEAIDLLNEGVLVSGKDVYSKSNIFAELARAYSSKGDDAAAEESMQKSLSISNNKNGLALEIAGDILMKKGETSKAVDSWKKAQKAGIRSSSLQQKIDQKKL